MKRAKSIVRNKTEVRKAIVSTPTVRRIPKIKFQKPKTCISKQKPKKKKKLPSLADILQTYKVPTISSKSYCVVVGDEIVFDKFPRLR